jgi:hypothetical protein
MTPASHTLYSLTLFLALAALKLWSERRHRIPSLVRAGAASMAAIRDVAHALPQSGQ